MDVVYSAGDTLTITMNMATDGMLPPRATSGGRTFVDELFAFSASLGTDYSGAWRDESTFAIRILDTANAGTPTMSGPCSLHNVSLAVFPEDYCIFNRLVLAPPPPPLPPGSTGTPPPPPAHPTFAPAYTGWPPPVYVFFNASANLRSVAGRSQFTREPTALSGSFGTSLPPALISFVADDYDNLDPTFSPGDTLTATFDMLTNMGGEALNSGEVGSPSHNYPAYSGGKRYVDTLLDFSASLGLDYSGHWADASTLVVTCVDPTDAEPPRIGLSTVRVRIGDHNVTNQHGSSLGCADSALLGGTFGSQRPPTLLSVVLADEDNGDEVYGYCDTLTFTFDMPTDKAGGKTDAYELFAFANPRAVAADAAAPFGVDAVAAAAGGDECLVPFGGECPVYDVTNGLPYTGEWSADGRYYRMRLQCPAPSGTPTAAAGATAEAVSRVWDV